MEEKEKLFKKLDKQVFSLVDKYSSSNFYSQVDEKMSSFNETQKKIIGQGLNLLCLLTPVFIVLFIAFGNVKQQSSIDTKKEILTYVEKFLYNKSQLTAWGNKIVSPMSFRSKDDLQNRLAQSVKFATLEDKPSIIVQNFEQEQLGENYLKSKAFVEFSNLSSKLLGQLLEEIVTITKCKVSSINFEKNSKNNFIKGSLELIHYGKK